jgi:hypothetical protein
VRHRAPSSSMDASRCQPLKTWNRPVSTTSSTPLTRDHSDPSITAEDHWATPSPPDDFCRHGPPFFGELPTHGNITRSASAFEIPTTNCDSCLALVVCDEDITTSDTTTPSIEVLGPITRSQEQQLRHQANSFLCSSDNDHENSLLPNDLTVIRNQ